MAQDMCHGMRGLERGYDPFQLGEAVEGVEGLVIGGEGIPGAL
jgi:hypothetical protein